MLESTASQILISSALPLADFALMPTNRRLLKWNETSDATSAKGTPVMHYKKPASSLRADVLILSLSHTTHVAELDNLLNFWEKAHVVRQVLFTLAWSALVACIVLRMN